LLAIKIWGVFVQRYPTQTLATVVLVAWVTTQVAHLAQAGAVVVVVTSLATVAQAAQVLCPVRWVQRATWESVMVLVAEALVGQQWPTQLGTLAVRGHLAS